MLDGTIVSPFLNSKDSESDCPWNLVEAFRIAAGEIPTNSKSKIHVMPFGPASDFRTKWNAGIVHEGY